MKVDKPALFKSAFHIVFFSLIMLVVVFPSWQEVSCPINEYSEVGVCYSDNLGRKLIGPSTISNGGARGMMIEIGPNYIEMMAYAGFIISLWMTLSALIMFRRKWLLLIFLLLSSSTIFCISFFLNCVAWISSGSSG